MRKVGVYSTGGGVHARLKNQMQRLFHSQVELSYEDAHGERFFHEVITTPVPLDMNILKKLKRSPLGLDLYLWLTYRTFTLKRPLRLTWPQLYRQFGADPARAGARRTVDSFRTKCLRELEKIQRAWPDLHYHTVTGGLVLSPSRRRNCGSWNSARVWLEVAPWGATRAEETGYYLFSRMEIS